MDNFQQSISHHHHDASGKKCDICGKVIFGEHKNRKRCSQECNKKAKKTLNARYYQDNSEAINFKARARYKKNIEYYKERDKKRREKKRGENNSVKDKKTQKSNSFVTTIKENNHFTGSSVLNFEHAKTNDLPNERLVAKHKRKKYVMDENSRERVNRRKREKYHSDHFYSLKNRIRSLVNKKLRDLDFAKSHTTEKYLGCDIQSLMTYLESNFKDGMSWENRDKWHIDHIVPISRAKNEDDFILLSHYSNLQPIWSEENIRKSNKLGFYNVTGKLVKKYGERGSFQQYRYEKVVDFNCNMCRKDKKAKLIAVYEDDWSKIICNGCYGRNLSIKY